MAGSVLSHSFATGRTMCLPSLMSEVIRAKAIPDQLTDDLLQPGSAEAPSPPEADPKCTSEPSTDQMNPADCEPNKRLLLHATEI